MTDQPTAAIVSQRARDAAADLIDQYWSGSDDAMRKLAASIRAGHRHGAFVRAFARFQAEIEAATIERCAGVCDDEAAKCLPFMRGFGVSANIETGRHRQANEIATAIRNLKGQTS